MLEGIQGIILPTFSQPLHNGAHTFEVEASWAITYLQERLPRYCAHVPGGEAIQ